MLHQLYKAKRNPPLILAGQCEFSSERAEGAVCAQNDFFWAMEPRPCDPKDLPKYEKSHELDMKRKRADNREGGHRQVITVCLASSPALSREFQCAFFQGCYLRDVHEQS